MVDIRESDRGYHTRVFSITSKTIGTKQICIGTKYEEKGRDRYNVYIVSNGAVGGNIGFYEVDQGTSVTDAQGVDFDVARFGEPNWTDIGKSRPKEVEKEEKEVEKDEKEDEKEEKEDEKDSDDDSDDDTPPIAANFKNLKTLNTEIGNCFYETVTRALSGPPDYKTSKEKVTQLRKDIGEYITSDARLPELIARYKNYIPGIMKKDELYGKYYNYRDDEGWDEEDIKKEMENEREKYNIPEEKLNFEVFNSHKPDDEAPYTITELFQTELNDYFQGRKDLKEDEIKEVFLTQINTPGIYANEFIVSNYQEMTNTKMLFLKHDSLKYNRDLVDIQTFELDDWTIYQEKILDEDTKFILSDYENMTHFSLIVQIAPPIGVFNQNTLPVEMQEKLASIQEKLKKKKEI